MILDFRGSVIRLRQVCRSEPGFVVEVPMPKWVVDRIKEGGDVGFAMIGLKDGEPYLALVAEYHTNSEDYRVQHAQCAGTN
ncbi:MAG: hypothetical protein L7G98_04900 [Vulcanisaeta sp.]|nr:hypothetical protein [Vulcanisaeta sp.]MCG2887277.1 hypothetical protein [Vulcanisaeta sp.]